MNSIAVLDKKVSYFEQSSLSKQAEFYQIAVERSRGKLKKAQGPCIGFGWESPKFYTRWMGDDELSDLLAGADLEPIQRQSDHVPEILRLFKKALLPNRDYVERVKEVYQKIFLFSRCSGN